jgi:hypothetical protein
MENATLSVCIKIVIMMGQIVAMLIIFVIETVYGEW